MSHAQPVFSPEGTPLPDRKVGELVAEQPSLSRVFQAHNLDFCCQGSRTLRQVCERKGMNLEQVIADIEAALAGPKPSVDNPADLEPSGLIDHIVAEHHGFLRRELPRLYAMSERVAHVHGGHTPTLIQLFQIFSAFAERLASSTEREESDVFPTLINALNSEGAASSINTAVSQVREEYQQAGEMLGQIRQLTDNYQPPPEACNTYRALFAGLADLDENLQRHIHLENSVLFPAAIEKAS